MTNEIQERITALPEEEFRTLRLWLLDEVKRRENAQAIARAEADLVRDLQDAGKLDRPAAVTDPAEDFEQVPEWADPGTDHSRMYQYGDIVRYEDRIVRSTHQGLNHWRPGELGFDGRIWEDITPRGGRYPLQFSRMASGEHVQRRRQSRVQRSNLAGAPDSHSTSRVGAYRCSRSV